VDATNLDGGTIKIVDSTVFNISTAVAVADVTVVPGGLRELHVRVALSWPVLIILTLLRSGTQLKTNGYMFCKSSLTNCRKFCIEYRDSGKAMPA
jgi:hypothetical protein